MTEHCDKQNKLNKKTERKKRKTNAKSCCLCCSSCPEFQFIEKKHKTVEQAQWVSPDTFITDVTCKKVHALITLTNKAKWCMGKWFRMKWLSSAISAEFSLGSHTKSSNFSLLDFWSDNDRSNKSYLVDSGLDVDWPLWIKAMAAMLWCTS